MLREAGLIDGPVSHAGNKSICANATYIVGESATKRSRHVSGAPLVAKIAIVIPPVTIERNRGSA